MRGATDRDLDAMAALFKAQARATAVKRASIEQQNVQKAIQAQHMKVRHSVRHRVCTDELARAYVWHSSCSGWDRTHCPFRPLHPSSHTSPARAVQRTQVAPVPHTADGGGSGSGDDDGSSMQMSSIEVLRGPIGLNDDDPELDLVDGGDEVDLIDVSNDLVSSQALNTALRNLQRARPTLKQPDPKNISEVASALAPRPRVMPEVSA